MPSYMVSATIEARTGDPHNESTVTLKMEDVIVNASDLNGAVQIAVEQALPDKLATQFGLTKNGSLDATLDRVSETLKAPE